MLVRPALDPATLTPRTTSAYPEPFRSRVLPREKRALGDALGLTKIGVNLTTLPPGKESALRHHHTREDSGDGHQLVNRTDQPARYLEISNRDPDDTAVYPDDDLAYAKVDGKPTFTRKDGSTG